MKLWQSVLETVIRNAKNKSSHKPVTGLNFEPLEVRSLLASHTLADAPDVDFKITDQWNTGHTAEFSLVNDEGVNFDGWKIEFDYGGKIANLWNATVKNLGQGRYRFTPPAWSNNLGPGQTLAVGFVADGAASMPTNISFNGGPITHSGDASTTTPDTNDAPSDETTPTENTPTDNPITDDPIAPADDSTADDSTAMPVIRIADAQVTEGDTGYVLASFTVSLSKASTETVTADYHTMTNSASSGTDFERATGTVTFAPGETAQTIDVRVTGDLVVEGDEQFEVMLTTPVGGMFEDSAGTNAGHVMPNPSPGEPLVVSTDGTFPYLSATGADSFRVLDLSSTGAHNVQLMLTTSGNLVVLGPFNGAPIQQHETPIQELLANTSASFLETRLPDPEEDPNQMISTWMQDSIAGLQISNAHLYCDAAGLFLGEKLGVVGGMSEVGYVVTSHRMDDSGIPLVNVIENFDPSSDKLDFQYFANREFGIADTPDGVLISASPQAYNAWGEKTLLRGVSFSELSEDNFVFRFEQKYEDGFNRFGGTSETTATDGFREATVVSSPLAPTSSVSNGGVSTAGEFSVTLSDSWDSGYVSQWTYSPELAVGSWQVTIQMDGEIQSIWNAKILSQDGNQYVIGNADYNGDLTAGQSANFGFDATGSGSSIKILSEPQSDNTASDTHDMHHDGNHMSMGVASGFGTIIDNDTDTPSEPTTPPMDEGDNSTTPPMDENDDSTMPPMEDHDGHDHMAPPASSGDYVDITSWGTFHGSNHNSEHNELVGGRTAITTEAHEAYNNLRAFLGFSAVTIEEVGEWAFSESLTNNSQAWENDLMGVGLWYAMQGAKVGWIADDKYDPQILADIQRTARTVEDPTAMRNQVMDMVRQHSHAGYADYLEQYGIVDTFINTLKMEPHYGGWMHGRTHGFRSLEGVAINHDVNHLTVLSWDQMQPFMNDTFDWPQWPALDVSDSGVIEYFQSMVSLGNPVGQNLESAPTSIAPPTDHNSDTTDHNSDTTDHNSDTTDHNSDTTDHNSDTTDHDSHTHPEMDSEYIDLADIGMSNGSDHTGHDGLVGGRTAITTEAHVAYNNLRRFVGLEPATLDQIGEWAFANTLTNNTQAWGNDQQGVGLWYAMQGAKVGWIADDVFDPQILADIQRTARLGTAEDVMAMVVQYGHEGFAEYLTENGYVDTFINTLKMEPHYAGWMHDRAHGWLSIEDVAIAHDVNHLTVLSHDQMQPFMNDTWDWPQWPALDVSHARVLEYFQSMVVLGDPLGDHLDNLSGPAPQTDPTDNNTNPTDNTTDPADNTTDTSTSDVSDPVSTPKIAAYFPEWGIYGRDYHIADVPAAELTHFIYAFANLTASGEMVLFDSFAATEKRFSAENTVSGEADLWSYPAGDPRATQTVWGNFNQVAQLKEQNPHLRTSIALGGWTLSANFSSVVSTQAGRETLARSIYDFLNTYTMFDGIDFDWEYPGGGGLSGNSSSPQDGANYAALLELVREQLDILGSERGRYYEISVASPGGSDKIANFNLPGLKDNVDFFNVMSYDFHGTWENTTGHQAALMNDPAGYDIETAINLYLDAGVAKENIVLGAPLYTRAWSGVADGGDNGYNEAASGAAPGTFESGNYDYKDLVAQLQSGTSDWELNWDDDGQAAYLYSASQQIYSSFETPGTISLKSEWAQDKGLGGMMFWDLSNDQLGPESLISAAVDSWIEGQTFAQITAASDLVFENIYGGNGVFDPVVESATTPITPTNNTGPNLPEPMQPIDDASLPTTPTDPIETPTNTQASPLQISFAKDASWYNGFNANVTISNSGSNPVNGWVLEFTFDGEISSIWNATILSRQGNRYMIQSADWNSNIPSNGEVSFGFTASGTELLAASDILLNGDELNA
ncbi:MAG: glycosyl hydrolase family 18 protein [Pirellulaceae bacterium]|nr:glycosyl hydrolase family 18 protein [Pirellulaceae bacterium]